jgi:hypothetical protein
MTQVIRSAGIDDSVGPPALPGDCGVEPPDLTYSRASIILRAHDRHLGCRQWIAAAAYLSYEDEE